MRKNTCPYIDSQGRCTHKLPKVEKRSKDKLPICPFNKANKCELYLEWLNQLKSRHGLPKAEFKVLEIEGEK